MSINQGKNPNMPPAGRDQETSGLPAERHFTPSTADNNSFTTGAGPDSAGFDAPATGSIGLDNPEVDLGDDAANADLDSRSSDEELEDYDDNDDDEA